MIGYQFPENHIKHINQVNTSSCKQMDFYIQAKIFYAEINEIL